MPLLTRRDLTRVHLLTVFGFLAVGGVLTRMAFFDYSPGSEMFHPHGYCYLWQPDLVAAHVVSDGLIGLSYVAISLTLIYLVRRARANLPFSWMFVAFGGFIIACGATHFVEIWTLWTPVFWLAADVKIITAVASVATAVVLPPLVPRVLAIIGDARLSEQRRVALEQARAELERRVEERTAELRIALERAEEASREKEAFLSIVSHELRTPLNAILGWSRMLLRTHDDPAFVARGLAVIDRNARAQAHLVEDLLDVSRVSRGTLRIRTEAVDLVAIVGEAVDVIGTAAAAKQVAIDTSVSPGRIPLVVDPRRIQQVIWNLLSNAVKFTPEGGRISVSVAQEGQVAVVEVSDTGIGIDHAFLPRLFERFSQADPSPTRAHQGLGVGLAISRHLVELHGGRLEAHSDGRGTGATFRMELPIRADAAAPDREATLEEPMPRLDRVRVLVVDDELDSRETLGTVLERAGATVVTADSADAAIHRLRAEPFDLLLSDIAMPAKDGLTLVRRLRESADLRLKAMPAIAVSAHAGEEDRERAVAAGFQSHVGKPVAPEDLVREVAAALARH